MDEVARSKTGLTNEQKVARAKEEIAAALAKGEDEVLEYASRVLLQAEDPDDAYSHARMIVIPALYDEAESFNRRARILLRAAALLVRKHGHPEWIGLYPFGQYLDLLEKVEGTAERIEQTKRLPMPGMTAQEAALKYGYSRQGAREKLERGARDGLLTKANDLRNGRWVVVYAPTEKVTRMMTVKALPAGSNSHAKESDAR